MPAKRDESFFIVSGQSMTKLSKDAVGDKIVDRLMLRLPRLDDIADRGVVSVSKENRPCVRVALIDMIYSVLLLVGAGQLMLLSGDYCS